MLEVIGNMIGKPISIDHITYEVGKFSYACILVEVTSEEAKRKEVILESYNGTIYKHNVEFEWLPWTCHTCNVFGHSTFLPLRREARDAQLHERGMKDRKVDHLGGHVTSKMSWAQVASKANSPSFNGRPEARKVNEKGGDPRKE